MDSVLITKNNTDCCWVQDKFGRNILSVKDDLKFGKKNSEININENVIIDNSEKFKDGLEVMTAWGLGKVVAKNESGTYTIKIEQTEVEFPPEDIKLNYSVYCCILCKDHTYWSEIKLDFNSSLTAFKKKISSFIKCHPSQIVIIYNGNKLENIKNLEELGIYDKCIFLVAIKDPQELSILRTRNVKTSSKSPEYNAIKFTVNQDIMLTGLGFYKNKLIDVFYDLFIFEECDDIDNKLILSEKKIFVQKDEFEENEVYKHKINLIELKENAVYQIHQYLHNSDSNQFIGIKGLPNVEEKNTYINFKFYNCEIAGRHNSTDVDEGMIPLLYFFVKTEI